jgi:hypothetical protein
VAPAVCAGTGSCPSPAVTTCEPYACDGTGCAAGCITSDDCASDHACVSGACIGREGLADYSAVGGGGCNAGGGGRASAAGLLLALAGLVALRRRSRAVPAALAAAALVGALVGAPAGARAAGDAVAIDVQRFQPAGGARDILGVGSAQTAGHLNWGLKVYGNYASTPLKLQDRSGRHADVNLLTEQSGLDFTGFVGLGERFELSVALPVAVSQGFDDARSSGLIPAFDERATQGGLSTLRLAPKARLASLGAWHLAVAAPVVVSLGTGAPYLDPGGPSIHPRAIVEWSPGVRIAANVGVAVRGERDLAGTALGNALAFGVGGEVPLELGGQRLDALATVVGETGLRATHEAETPLELLVGARWVTPTGVALTLAAGPGLTSGYGTPEVRIVGGFAFVPGSVPAICRDALREPAPAARPAAAPRRTRSPWSNRSRRPAGTGTGSRSGGGGPVREPGEERSRSHSQSRTQVSTRPAMQPSRGQQPNQQLEKPRQASLARMQLPHSCLPTEVARCDAGHSPDNGDARQGNGALLGTRRRGLRPACHTHGMAAGCRLVQRPLGKAGFRPRWMAPLRRPERYAPARLPALARLDRTRPSSSATGNGFRRCPWTDGGTASSPAAETTATETRASAGSVWIARRHHQPSITGMPRSSRTRSGGAAALRRRSSASWPFVAPSAAYPASRRTFTITLRSAGSSSTTRIRAVSFVGAWSLAGMASSAFDSPPARFPGRRPGGRAY